MPWKKIIGIFYDATILVYPQRGLTRIFHRQSAARPENTMPAVSQLKMIPRNISICPLAFLRCSWRSHCVRYLHSWPFQSFHDDLCEIWWLSKNFDLLRRVAILNILYIVPYSWIPVIKTRKCYEEKFIILTGCLVILHIRHCCMCCCRGEFIRLRKASFCHFIWNGFPKAAEAVPTDLGCGHKARLS